MSQYVPNINKILESSPVNSRRGAPMGARNQVDDLSEPLLLQQIEYVDGDYAPDGTYWGGAAESLWCAFNPDTKEYKAGMGTRIYVRASSFKKASEQVLEIAYLFDDRATCATQDASEPTEPYTHDNFRKDSDMTEHYTSGAGKLDFKKETPILKAFLPLFNQDPSRIRIAFRSQLGYPLCWSDKEFVDRLREACEAHQIDSRVARGAGDASEAVEYMLAQLYLKTCEIQRRPVDPDVLQDIQAIGDRADFSPVPVTEAVLWLKILDDGHGLRGAEMIEAYHADDLAEYGMLGGAVLVDTPHVYFHEETGEMSDHIASLSKAIEAGDTERAALYMTRHMSKAASCVLDADVRATVLQRAIQMLQDRFALVDDARDAQTDGNFDNEVFDDVPH